MNIPTAEEFSNDFTFLDPYSDYEVDFEKVYSFARQFAKMHVKEALKAVEEKTDAGNVEWCYPLDLIK